MEVFKWRPLRPSPHISASRVHCLKVFLSFSQHAKAKEEEGKDKEASLSPDCAILMDEGTTSGDKTF